MWGIRCGLFLAIIPCMLLLYVSSFKVSNQLSKIMRNHAKRTEFRDWTKQAIEPRTFGELHMNECRSFFITTNFVRFFLFYFVCALGAEISFLPFLTRRQPTVVVFFSGFSQENQRIERKKSFWRHKYFMRILIEIICGMRMTSKHKRFSFLSEVLCVCFFSEKRNRCRSSVNGYDDVTCNSFFRKCSCVHVKSNIAHHVGILIGDVLTWAI